MNLSDIASKYVKKVGPGAMVKGSEIMFVDYPRIPTGIYAVDYATGGGFPVGVTSSIYGPPGGGKTLLSLCLAANAQSLCWNCFCYLWDCKCKKRTEKEVLIISTEILDVSWGAKWGVDPDKLWIVEPESGEIAGEIIADRGLSSRHRR